METLYTLRGRVLAFRRDADPILVNRWINDRIRQVIDSKLYWSSLVSTGVIKAKGQYSRGTVSLVPGSSVVTGQDTEWPVDDAASTRLASAVEEIGYVEAQVEDRSGIEPGMWLLVGDSDPEPVAVAELTESGFIGRFTRTHISGETVKASRLAGMQFRLDVSTPVYDVRAVTSPTTLVLDRPWAGKLVSGSTYRIVHSLVTMPPDLKTVLWAVDPTQGVAIQVNLSYKYLALVDPQRTDYGWIRALVEAGPDETGTMRYEMWPPPAEGVQIYYVYARYWPELRKDSDPAPWFIDGQVIADGAIADALNWRRSADDPYHNPRLAQFYEARFRDGLERLKAQDEARVVKDLDFWPRLIGVGADWCQRHAVDEAGVWMI